MHLYRAGLPLLGVLSISAQAAPSSEDLTAQGPGFIQMSLKAPELSSKSKRQTDVGLKFASNYKYDIEFSLGTPGQKILGSFDTGSSYIWVRDKTEASVNTNVIGGRSYFDKSSSSTLERTGESATSGYYVANSAFKIDLYRDSMSLGGLDIKNATFGIINNAPKSLDGFNSIFGFGMADKPPSEKKKQFVPPTMTLLVDQGLIGRRVFSLEIGDSGVLVGGVNRKKFGGRLGKQNMTVHPYHGKDYVISFNEVSSTAEDGSKSTLSRSDEGIPALLDTGSTINTFPPSIFQAILEKFPDAKPVTKSPVYSVDCSVRNINASIDLAFGATTIKMPYSNLIFPVNKEGTLCIIGMTQDEKYTVLGQPFMRGAYIVMDQDNRAVYLANAANCGSDPVAIDKDLSDIATLTGLCPPSPLENPSRCSNAAPGTSPSENETIESKLPNQSGPKSEEECSRELWQNIEDCSQGGTESVDACFQQSEDKYKECNGLNKAGP